MDKEQLHQEDLQRLRGFRLIDDDFMNACFDDNIEGTELILRIILNKPDLSVKSVKTQKVMKNLLGRDIWLDISATDSNNVEHDIDYPDFYIIPINTADVNNNDIRFQIYRDNLFNTHAISAL